MGDLNATARAGLFSREDEAAIERIFADQTLTSPEKAEKAFEVAAKALLRLLPAEVTPAARESLEKGLRLMWDDNVLRRQNGMIAFMNPENLSVVVVAAKGLEGTLGLYAAYLHEFFHVAQFILLKHAQPEVFRKWCTGAVSLLDSTLGQAVVSVEIERGPIAVALDFLQLTPRQERETLIQELMSNSDIGEKGKQVFVTYLKASLEENREKAIGLIRKDTRHTYPAYASRMAKRAIRNNGVQEVVQEMVLPRARDILAIILGCAALRQSPQISKNSAFRVLCGPHGDTPPKTNP